MVQCDINDLIKIWDEAYAKGYKEGLKVYGAEKFTEGQEIALKEMFLSWIHQLDDDGFFDHDHEGAK